MHIAVFAHDANPYIDRPLFRVKSLRAGKMLRSNEAKAVLYGAKRAGLQLLGRTKPSGVFGGGAQGEVYKAVAIEKHPLLLQGGLVRTEHQPNPKPGILAWGHLDDAR